jgi:hypothetical protein
MALAAEPTPRRGRKADLVTDPVPSG